MNILAHIRNVQPNGGTDVDVDIGWFSAGGAFSDVSLLKAVPFPLTQAAFTAIVAELLAADVTARTGVPTVAGQIVVY